VTAITNTMTERALQSAIIHAARSLGWMVYWTWNSRHSPEGYPDLVLVKNGVILVYELKTEKGRMRPMQQEWLDALAGATVKTSRVIRPGDLDDVLKELQEAA
jgi:hypothetical protein